jgi:hypothetical protein
MCTHGEWKTYHVTLEMGRNKSWEGTWFAFHCLKMESGCTYKILFLIFQYGKLSSDQLALLHCLETVSQHANFYVSIYIYIYSALCYSQFVNLILVLIKPRIKLLDQIRLINWSTTLQINSYVFFLYRLIHDFVILRIHVFLIWSGTINVSWGGNMHHKNQKYIYALKLSDINKLIYLL